MKSGRNLVDLIGMDSCASCGAAVTAAATWCGQCFAVRQPLTAASSVRAYEGPYEVKSAAPPSQVSRVRAAPAPAPPPPATVSTRWGKTATTFGPVGRVVCTIGLVVPFVLFVVLGIVGDPLTLGGAGVWGLVIMPWGLRDTWRAGRRPAR